MPTVFESISDGFYTAFFEPDPEKRRTAIEAWIKVATRVIQSSVEDELRSHLESVFKDTWTPEGWKSRVEKFNRLSDKLPYIDTYKLCLDIKLRQRTSSDTDVVGALTLKIRAKTLEAAEAAKAAIAKIGPPPPGALRAIDLPPKK